MTPASLSPRSGGVISTDVSFGTVDPAQPEYVDELGAFIESQFRIASSARSSLEAEMLSCLRQRKCEYSAEEEAAMGSIKTYAALTATKCRAGEAWMHDIIVSAGERVWTIGPTPEPRLPKFLKDMVVQQVQKEFMKMGLAVEAPQVKDMIRRRAQELKRIAEYHQMKAASEATANMTKKIDDQLIEAKFMDEVDKFVSDLMTYPFAVMKGPVMVHQRKFRWNEDELVETVEVVPSAWRVSPFDFYWMPWNRTVQDGAVMEVQRLTPGKLHDCIGLPFFSEKAIRHIIDTMPTGFKHSLITFEGERKRLEGNANATVSDEDLYDIIVYCGQVKGSVLKLWGATDIEDENKAYEVEAWTINGVCIRMTRDPHLLGRRPYHVTCFEKTPGSIAGVALPNRVRPHQEIINSAYRALRRNMGLASGPFAEVVQTRLADGQAPQEISPAMVKLVEDDPTGADRPVYRFHNIQSHAAELVNVIQTETRAADDASGIPAYTYGNAAGGAARTVGGFAMVLGQASKGIKRVIGYMEDDILEPIIEGFYNYNMKFSDDDAIKADAQVVCKGLSGVIEKDTISQRRMEMLQIVTPYVQMGIVPRNGLAIMLREMFRDTDLPVDQIIPDPTLAAEMQNAAAAMMPPGSTGQPMAPPNMPPDAPPGMGTGPGGVPMPGGPPVPAMPGPGQPSLVAPPPGGGTTPMAVMDGRMGAAQGVLPPPR